MFRVHLPLELTPPARIFFLAYVDAFGNDRLITRARFPTVLGVRLFILLPRTAGSLVRIRWEKMAMAEFVTLNELSPVAKTCFMWRCSRSLTKKRKTKTDFQSYKKL